VQLTRPVSPEEALAHRAAGAWGDDVPVDLDTVRAGGDRVALLDREGAVTYTELASSVEQVAAGLEHLGVGTGDSVVVVTDNDRESVAACHAVWHRGAVALLVHRSAGASDVRLARTTSSPKVVLLSPTAGAAGDGAAEVGPVVAVADLLGTPVERADTLAVPVDPDAARLVVFTSGTTSKPKGVVHTVNTLRASAANFHAMTDLERDERFFLVSPLASIAGVLQVLQLAPGLGAAAVLERAWDDEETFDLLVGTGGTFYGGTDTVLARLFDVARQRGAAVPLRAVSVGGTMLRRDVLDAAEDEFGIRVLRVYGSSEAPSSTGARPAEPRDVRLADDGLPAPLVELRVPDDDAREVLLRGPHVFRGYLDPVDNDECFDGDWFRTGDAGEIRDGRLRVVGRLKEIANRSGRKVSLAEVEDAFRAATDVPGCAAFAAPDDVTGEHVALAVQIPEGELLDVPAALDAMVAAGLAKWKLPESVVSHPAPFPTTATGKVRRGELSELSGPVLWQADRLGRAENAALNAE